MIRPTKPSVGDCWKGLRQLDNLEGILLLLGTKFNTSLLADYRCLHRIVSGKVPTDDGAGTLLGRSHTTLLFYGGRKRRQALRRMSENFENRKNEVALRRFAAVSFIEQKVREGFGVV
jgi:hypothetical protein